MIPEFGENQTNLVSMLFNAWWEDKNVVKVDKDKSIKIFPKYVVHHMMKKRFGYVCNIFSMGGCIKKKKHC